MKGRKTSSNNWKSPELKDISFHIKKGPPSILPTNIKFHTIEHKKKILQVSIEGRVQIQNIRN